MSIREFVELNFRHFNAREVRDAARGYVDFVEKQNGHMFQP
jgi:hypothetical protein